MKLLRRFLAPLLAFLVALAPAQPQLSLPIAPATVLAVSAVTAAINFTPLSAGALTPAERPVILGGIQSWSFPGSSADLYFARNAGSCAINRLLKPCASLLTTTRASTGYAQWADGHLSLFAANVPRITDLGLLVEQAATNTITNNSFSGAATGTPGTLPTGWSLTNTSGISVNVAGLGTDNGLPYMDVQLTGTPSSSTAIVLAPTGFGSSSAPAAQGQVWTSSLYNKIIAGATTNFSFVSNFINENNSSNAFQSNGNAAIGPTGVFTRALFTRTLVSATTAFIYQTINFGVTSGQAVNLTLRIYGQQLEQFSAATSPILTTTVAVTRAADVISLTGAASTAALAAKAAYVQSNLVAGGTLPRLIHYSGGAFMDYASSTTTLISNATNTATATMGSGTYTGLVHNSYGMGTASITAISNNGTKATSANAWAANTGTVYVGSNNGSNALNGYMPRLALGAAFSQFDGVTQ